MFSKCAFSALSLSRAVPSCENSFRSCRDRRHRLQALRSKGFLVVKCDNRGSNRTSTQMSWVEIFGELFKKTPVDIFETPGDLKRCYCCCFSRTQCRLAIRQCNQHAPSSSEAKSEDLVQYGTHCSRPCLDLALTLPSRITVFWFGPFGPYVPYLVLSLRRSCASGRGLNFEGGLKFDMGNIEVEDQARSSWRYLAVKE